MAKGAGAGKHQYLSPPFGHPKLSWPHAHLCWAERAARLPTACRLDITAMAKVWGRSPALSARLHMMDHELHARSDTGDQTLPADADAGRPAAAQNTLRAGAALRQADAPHAARHLLAHTFFCRGAPPQGTADGLPKAAGCPCGSQWYLLKGTQQCA